MVKLISGTFIAQVISIAISPVLSRIFQPEDFGLFTLVSSIYAFVALVSGGRYEQAILLPKRQTEAANLLVLSLFINTLFSLVLFVGLVLFLNFYPNQPLGIWYFLLPVFILIVGYTQSLQAWLNRRKKYTSLAQYRVSVSFLNNGLSLFNGWMKFQPNGLLSAFLVSNFTSLFVLIHTLKADWKLIKRSVSSKQMKQLAKKHIHFPLFNSFQSLLDAFQINGIVYIISFLHGAYFVGIFSLSLRILFMPMNFIGGSISQVFFQESSEHFQQNKPLIPLVKRTALRSVLVILPVVILILLFGPVLFSFVFGNKWLDAGIYAQLLTPWILLDFIRAPLSQIPLILGKQRIMLTFSVFSNLGILVLVLISTTFFPEIDQLLLLLSIGQSVYLIILLFWIVQLAKQSDLKRMLHE